MQGHSRKRSLTLWGAALCAALALAIGFSARPAAAAPFAYVANSGSNTVSVIDTASNTVVATVAVGASPDRVAGTPDETRVYVASAQSNYVSVIDTASNAVVATIPTGVGPVGGIAITPDEKRAYVNVTAWNSTVVVIDTVATVPIYGEVGGRCHHPGWKTRLCGDLGDQASQHCLGDRHGQQHGGDHGPPS